jgi:hypothetical protein
MEYQKSTCIPEYCRNPIYTENQYRGTGTGTGAGTGWYESVYSIPAVLKKGPPPSTSSSPCRQLACFLSSLDFRYLGRSGSTNQHDEGAQRRFLTNAYTSDSHTHDLWIFRNAVLALASDHDNHHYSCVLNMCGCQRLRAGKAEIHVY